MNLLESIKSKYGVVNIYNLVALIDEMISNKIKERSIEVEQDNKKYYYALVRNALLSILSSESDLSEVSIDSFGNMVDMMIGVSTFSESEHEADNKKAKTYRELLFDDIYQTIGDCDFTEDNYNELILYSDKCNKLFDTLDSVESGNLPNGVLEQYSEEVLEECLLDIYKYLFKDKLNS